MKKIMLSASIFAAVVFTGADKLTGRWETRPSEKGNVTGVVFKDDQSFEGYVNKKPFTSGSYTLQDSLFTMEDNGCNGAKGTYKIIFFSNNDSLRLVPMDDPCIERAEGVSRMIMGRVK